MDFRETSSVSRLWQFGEIDSLSPESTELGVIAVIVGTSVRSGVEKPRGGGSGDISILSMWGHNKADPSRLLAFFEASCYCLPKGPLYDSACFCYVLRYFSL
jgi:hypothetical protein